MASRALFVIGCGSIGLRHIRNLLALEVGAVFAIDVDRDRLAEAGRVGARVVRSTEEGFEHRPVAVVVCTPPHLHVSMARSAIKAGAHVFVEKPLAPALDGALDELLTAARAARRLVVVGYNLRFHTPLVVLREALKRGDIGRALIFQAEFGQYLPDWRPGRDYRAGYGAKAAWGGGILLDASHELDYLQWLGGEATAVHAVLEHLSDLETDAEDTALLTLRMHSGALAQVHLDCVQHGYARRCKVIGSQGTLVWDWHTGVTMWIAGRREWLHISPTEDPATMYVEEMRHFLAALEGRQPPAVTGEDARQTLAIMEAARLSAKRRAEVSL